MPASPTPSDSGDTAAALHQAKQHFDKALQALERRQWEAAAQGFEAVTRLAPQIEAGHFNLGNALFELKRFSEAILSYQQAFELSPLPGTLNNLGNAYSATSQWAQASDCYHRALQMLESQSRPVDPAEKNSLIGNLSQSLQHWGRHSQAAEVLLNYWLGSPSAQQLQRLLRCCLWIPADDRTRVVLKLVDALPSPSAQTLLLAADCHHHLAQYSEELACLVKASQVAVDHPEVLARMARHQFFRGRHPEATLCLHRSLTTSPASASQQSHWLRNSLHHGSTDFEQLHREATAWATAHAAPLRQTLTPSATPHGITRMGWVITQDSPAWFLQSLGDIVRELELLSKECVIYSDLTTASSSKSMLQDSISTSSRAAWKSTSHLTDQQLHELIIADQVDCLIDTSGHGPHTRLPVFARRSAPLQLASSHIGMTTGLKSMDVLLADTRLIPESAQGQFTETVVHIDPFVYFKHTVASAPPYTRDHSQLRLGILCSPDRLTRELLTIMASVLVDLPAAMLSIAHHTFHDVGLQQEVSNRCVQAGIASSQLHVAAVQEADYVPWLSSIDLLIDPIPLGQLESVIAALSAGIPVVALAGNTLASRMTASVLSYLGLADYVAHSSSEYRERIVGTAKQLVAASTSSERMKRAQSIRDRLDRSPLFDAARYARQLIHATLPSSSLGGSTGAASSGRAPQADV